MCVANELETMDESEVLFSEDIELLEDCLTDIILTMGLPEEQANAALRLVSDALETHHSNILDTFETVLEAEESEEE